MNIEVLKKYKEEICISVIFLLFAAVFNRYLLSSDGRVYYSVLEDVLFRGLNPNPLPTMKMDEGGYQQFGVAFFWMPFYLVGILLSKLTIFNFNPIDTGHGFLSITTVFINLASNFYALLALLLGIKIIRLLQIKINLVFSVIIVFLSTPFFVYAIPFAQYNHAVDTFIITLIIYLYLLWKDKNAYLQFFLGSLAAISVLVRYLDIGIFIFLLIFYLLQKKYKYAKLLFLGFLALIWVAPVLFHVVNGSVFKAFVLTVKGDTLANTGIISIIPRYSLKLLFHPMHGLFWWSPVTILSFFGLIRLYEDDNKTALFLAGTFISLLILQGCFYNWHAGWSFSQRYLTGMFAVFLVGFAYFLSKFPKIGTIASVIFAAYTLFLLLNWGSVIHGELGTPIDMVCAWMQGKANPGLILGKIAAFFKISLW